MPLILDHHHAGEEARAGGGTGFDLQTASTLYWKPIPIKLKQQDREDQHEQLTFRILTGVARQNHNLRVGHGCRRPMPGIFCPLSWANVIIAVCRSSCPPLYAQHTII